MSESIRAALGSKKFLAALLSVAAAIVSKWGFDLPVAEILTVVAPLWVYIFGQGLADFGKHGAESTGDTLLALVEDDEDPTGDAH